MQKALFHIGWVIFACLTASAWGQVTSPLGRFQVDYAKGCAPLTVTVTDLTGGPTAQYLFDADTCVVSSPKYDPTRCPPSSNTTNTTYTYTQPGTYSLVQVVASQVPRGDTIMIEVLPPQQPEVHFTLCNNYGVHLNIIDTYYDRFQIDFGDGSPLVQTTTNVSHTYPPGTTSYPITVRGYFNNGPVNCGSTTEVLTPVDNIPEATITQVTVLNQGFSSGQVRIDYILSPDVRYILQGSANGTSVFHNIEIPTGTSHTVFDLNTIDSVYCFRIVSRDRCAVTETYSNTVCTTTLQAEAQNGQNQVDWKTFVTPEFSQYEVDRNNAPMGSPITVGSMQSTTDGPTICGELYCYQVTTVYNDGGRSVSIARCVNGINNNPPPQVTSLVASVDGSSITINWNLTIPINFYRVFRSENNGPFEGIGQGTTLPYTDSNLRPQVNDYCYYVIYQNSCGIQSEPSVVACAIRLSGSNPDNRNYVLTWTPYNGFGSNLSEYQLEIMDENGSLVGPPISLGTNATSYMDPITQNRQISQYRIAAISGDSIPLTSYSNIIRVDIPLQIFIPNSFTPNNDGLNDTFNAKGLFINEYSMEIYNRWGELLYHSADLEQGWNGLYKGSLCPEGTYVYKIEATDTKGRAAVKNGTLHLLRKDN